MSENYGLPPKDPALIEIKRLRAERDALRADLAAARAECVRRQTIIGEVALERDAARARLDSVAERDRLAIAAVEGVQQMRIDLAAARATEKQLRHLLFLAHGNAEHYLYGDDGERQCNTCMIDFNVDTPNEIAQKITNYYNRKHYALAGKDAPVKYGCHCDIETMPEQFEPDGCVFDSGDIEDCIYATQLQREGKGKLNCGYWKPIKVAL